MLKSQQAFFILYIKKRRKKRCIFVETTENKPYFLSSPPVYQLVDFHIQPAVYHQGNVQKKTRELLTKMKLQRDVWMILAACLSWFITLIYPDVPPIIRAPTHACILVASLYTLMSSAHNLEVYSVAHCSLSWNPYKNSRQLQVRQEKGTSLWHCHHRSCPQLQEGNLVSLHCWPILSPSVLLPPCTLSMNNSL